MQRYRNDEHSPYKKLRYRTKQNYDSVLRRIEEDRGPVHLVDINARVLIGWHKDWSADGKIAMAHSLIGMMRMLTAFGASVLEDNQAERLNRVLAKMRFKMSKPRTERLTEEQASAIRETAHKMGYPSIALAQALQFATPLLARKT